METRVFNQAIKRNMDSFPEDFMFRLTSDEWKEVSSSQFVIMKNKPFRKVFALCIYRARRYHGSKRIEKPKGQEDEHSNSKGFHCAKKMP